MVSKETLDKLKSLYVEKFKIVLSDKEARKITKDLLNLMSTLIKSEPQTNLGLNFCPKGGEAYDIQKGFDKI